MDVTTPGNIGFASSGELEIELYDSTNRGPVRGAQVSIYRASDGEKIASYVSDGAGQIPDIRVETPPLEYSLESQAMGMPYGQYNIVVEAAGYETLELTNAEVLPQERRSRIFPKIGCALCAVSAKTSSSRSRSKLSPVRKRRNAASPSACSVRLFTMLRRLGGRYDIDDEYPERFGNIAEFS